MLLNLEPQWGCCQWLSCLLFEVAHYVISDPNLDKRWTHSCFAVFNCSWGQRRCEEAGQIFPFLLLKKGGPAGWAGSRVLRSTISAFPVNFDLELLSCLVAIWKQNVGFTFHDFLFSGGCLVQLLSAHLQRKTLMYLGNCKKQKKGIRLHCNINKLHGFQQALREEAFAVRIIFKIACSVTIGNFR